MPDKIYNEIPCLNCGREFSSKGTEGTHYCMDCKTLNCIQACIDKKEQEERVWQKFTKSSGLLLYV